MILSTVGGGGLDNIIPSIIHDGNPRKTKIHLFYSKNEHTYEDDIIDLIKELKEYDYPLEETVCHFSTHGEVGTHFAPFLDEKLKQFTDNQ